MKTVNKLTAIAFGLSMTGLFVSGGIYLIQSSRKSESAVAMTPKFKNAAIIFGGAALLALGVKTFVGANPVKQIKDLV